MLSNFLLNQIFVPAQKMCEHYTRTRVRLLYESSNFNVVTAKATTVNKCQVGKQIFSKPDSTTFCGNEKKLFIFVVLLHYRVQKQSNGTRIMVMFPVNTKISFPRVDLVEKKKRKRKMDLIKKNQNGCLEKLSKNGTSKCNGFVNTYI